MQLEQLLTHQYLEVRELIKFVSTTNLKLKRYEQLHNYLVIEFENKHYQINLSARNLFFPKLTIKAWTLIIDFKPPSLTRYTMDSIQTEEAIDFLKQLSNLIEKE